jgi:hypothetical protein
VVEIDDTYEEPVCGVALVPVLLDRVAHEEVEVLERRDRTSVQRALHDVACTSEATHPEGVEIPFVREPMSAVLVLETVHLGEPDRCGVVVSM